MDYNVVLYLFPLNEQYNYVLSIVELVLFTTDVFYASRGTINYSNNIESEGLFSKINVWIQI